MQVRGRCCDPALSRFEFDAKTGEQPHHRRDIAQIRHVFQSQRFRGQQRRRQYRQRRVFGTGDADFPFEASPARDRELVHPDLTAGGRTLGARRCLDVHGMNGAGANRFAQRRINELLPSQA